MLSSVCLYDEKKKKNFSEFAQFENGGKQKKTNFLVKPILALQLIFNLFQKNTRKIECVSYL